MGGKSSSSLDISDGVANFSGNCAIVPFLNAPGFITVQTGGFGQSSEGNFPDVSSCTGLKMIVRSHVDYDGYRVSFGKKRSGEHGMGYKARKSRANKLTRQGSVKTLAKVIDFHLESRESFHLESRESIPLQRKTFLRRTRLT